MKFFRMQNPVALTYNGARYESGLREFRTTEGTALSWCVNPGAPLRKSKSEYFPTRLPKHREDQVGWVIATNHWGRIEDMTPAEQDALSLVLKEAWLEDTNNPMDLGSGTSVITGEGEATILAESWLQSSQGRVANGVEIDITILQDPHGQDQATWTRSAVSYMPPGAMPGHSGIPGYGTVPIPSTFTLIIPILLGWAIWRKTCR